MGPARLLGGRAPADASVEARLHGLEAGLATLRTEQRQTANELQEATRKTNEAVGTERQARESALTALRVQLQSPGVGGLHVEWMGIGWLVLGTVLATIPGEIAVAFQWLARRLS